MVYLVKAINFDLMSPNFGFYIEFNVLEAIICKNRRNMVSFESRYLIRLAYDTVPLQNLFHVLNMLSLILKLMDVD